MIYAVKNSGRKPTSEETRALVGLSKHVRALSSDCGQDFASYLLDMAVEALEADLADDGRYSGDAELKLQLRLYLATRSE